MMAGRGLAGRRALTGAVVAVLIALVARADGASAAESTLFAGDPLAVEGVGVLAGGSGELPPSPEAQALHAQSEVAYEGLSASESRALVDRSFPQAVDETEGGPPPLRSGEVLEGFPTDNAMTVSDGGQHVVVESSQPLAVQGPGGRVPVDLGLVEVAGGGGFAAKTPAAGAQVRFPAELSEGLSVPELGVSLTPVDEHGAALPGSGVLDGASVVYAGSEDASAGVQDLSTVVKPVTGGLDVLSVLESKRSPERLYFRVDLPEGATLEQEAPGVVGVVFAGKAMAQIAAPAGRDAEGRPVPLSLSVAGDVVIVTVPRSANSYEYPLLIDPYVAKDEYLTGYGSPTNWKFCASDDVHCENHSSAKFRSTGWGNVGGLTTEPVGGYEAGQSVSLQYLTEGESKIFEASGVEASGSNPSGNIESGLLLANTEKIEGIRWLSLPPETAYSVSGTYVCPEKEPGVFQCEPGLGKEKNSVLFQQSAASSGSTFSDTLSRATVRISQQKGSHASFNTLPTISYTEGGKLVERENVLSPGSKAWLGPHANTAFEAIGNDPGVGVSFMSVVAGAWKVERKFLEEQLCAGIQCRETVVEPVVYKSGMPEGEDNVEVAVKDATTLGFGEGAQATVKVDATPPTGLKVGGLPKGNLFDGATYRLTAQATDGSGTTPSSGIRSLALGVDGSEIPGGKSGSCEPGPCTASGEWALNGEDLGAGKHELELVATDNAGNVEKASYEITVRHASPLPIGPGSVDPITGSFTLGSDDVSIGGGFGALTVSRSFNSRQLSAGAEGPLGPQWSISISGEQGLESEPTGDVTLVAEDGSRTTFSSDGKGGFISPKGDESLTLSAEREGEVVKAYLLTNPAKGTTVRFVHPAGASSNSLWTIAKSEGAVSKNTGEALTYKWEVLEGVERPKEALAPAPPGVSCEPEPKNLTELKVGCRALSFTYAAETKTGSGEAPSEWGEYKGRLMKVSFTAYNPTTKAMETKAVAEYAYDKQGRLRSEWDPRIAPELKTTYGYDGEGRVVAVSPAGQEPWLLHYGTIAGDASAGRLLSVVRPPASTKLESGLAPSVSTLPALSSTTPAIGTTLSVSSNGTWSGSPLAYEYQWSDCNSKGEACAAIPGAVNQSYTPQVHDAGYTLVASVTAFNADGAAVASTAASSAVALPAPKYSSKFGSLGEGAGQLKAPAGVAIDGNGNVWVADHNNNRLDEFSASGSFVETIGWGVSNGLPGMETCTSSCRAGISGSGSGQFSNPDGLAISGEDIYVADAGNDRIEEIATKGEYVRSFGTAGSEPGKLQNPVAVAVAPSSGNLWVADRNNNRIDEFTETGSFIGSFGTVGTGNGQFKEPSGIAFSGEYAYIVDAGNNRVQQLTLSGSYVAQFGSAGSGSGQFSKPGEIVTEPISGDLFVADSGNNRIEAFNPAGSFLVSVGSSGEGEGQFKGVEAIAITPSGNAYVADLNNNRVQKFLPTYSTNNPYPEPPSVGSDAVSTVEYGVSLTGNSELPKMTESAVAEWGQSDHPSEATGVYPPDEPMGWPAKDYKRASVWYFDSYGRTVNVRSPSGGVSTSEYNETNDVTRTVSAANRALALKEGCESESKCKSAEVAKSLDTEFKYNSQGTELLETLGPEHTIRLAGGTTEKRARHHMRYFYDEGAPEGETYGLVTKTIDSARYEASDHEERTTVTSYSGQGNLGWVLRRPTSSTIDPSGLKLTTTTVYNPSNGDVLETQGPADSAGGVPAGSYLYNYQMNFAVRTALQKPHDDTIDSSGNVWVTDTEANHVDEYSSTGKYIVQFGTEGSGNGQFKKPDGIAVDSKGDVWVVDTGNDRIQEFSSTGEYIRKFGAEGAGNGQFKGPEGITVDSSNHVWVSDTGNYRVQELSSTGEYIRQFGSQGTGEGQFEAPQGIAIDSGGNVWVVDGSIDSRVEKFSSTGEYKSKFGSFGSGNGQLEFPWGIAIDSSGNVWIADTLNQRLEEFSSSGEYKSQFGAEGSGNGQFKSPYALAFDSSGDFWVADGGNHRIQKLNSKQEYVLQITEGSTPLNGPHGVAVDSYPHEWVADTEANRIDEYRFAGEAYRTIGSQGTGNGQFKKPTGVAIDSSYDVWVTDTGNNRVEELSPEGAYLRQFGSEGAGNGQFSKPEGIAIDSGGHIWVADRGNDRVEEFSSTGGYIRQFGSQGSGAGQFEGPAGIAIDASGDVWVVDDSKLEPFIESRVEEFNSSGEYMTQFGTNLEERYRLSEPWGIAVDRGHVWVADSRSHRIEEFSVDGEYLAQFGAEGTGNGQFQTPVGVAFNSHHEIFVTDSVANRTQEFVGKAGSPHASQTVYYTPGANAEAPACGGRPEWANLPCVSQPAQQPASGDKLPVVTDGSYNMWDEPETITEEFGTTTRTKKNSYDAAGRLTESEVTSTLGTAVPKVTYEYSKDTGALLKQSTTVSGKTQTIITAHNKLGQLSEYTDADNNKTTYAYDVDGRMSETNDGKGTRTYAYDPTMGDLTKLFDATSGMTFTATYDLADRLTSEKYPNGMTAKYTYDEVGEPTSIEYVKEAHCAGTCPETWFSETVAHSIHGEPLARGSSLASEAYTYDKAGRLTKVQETPAGKGCVTRAYGYDTDSNRLSLTTYQPNASSECSTTSGSAEEKHSYDEADRLTDAGTGYDAFGNTLTVPATDAEGHEVKSTYYVSNQTRTTSQNGKMLTYELDPEARSREVLTEEGAVKTSVINHYPGPGDAIAWTCEPESGKTCETASKYTRNIPGIDGALTATEKSSETPVLQLHDLQGDIIATAAKSETETKLLSTYNSTEFGVPVNGTPPKYAWLGAAGLSTEFATGATASTGAGYIPQLGRALQTQPVTPPGANPSGTWAQGPYAGPSEGSTGELGAAWGAEAPQREAARQKKTEEEALEKVEQGCAIASMCVVPEEYNADPIHEYLLPPLLAIQFGNALCNCAADKELSKLANEIFGEIGSAVVELLLEGGFVESFGRQLYNCGEYTMSNPRNRCRITVHTVGMWTPFGTVDLWIPYSISVDACYFYKKSYKGLKRGLNCPGKYYGERY